MLVLSRRIGEEIVVGADIHVRVLAVRGNQVRLGFTAPPEVPIRRAEICPQQDAVSVISLSTLPIPDVA